LWSAIFAILLFIYLEIGALLANFGQQMVFCIEDLQHRRTGVRRGGGGACNILFRQSLRFAYSFFNNSMKFDVQAFSNHESKVKHA
jgi:hypothetical protein